MFLSVLISCQESEKKSHFLLKFCTIHTYEKLLESLLEKKNDNCGSLSLGIDHRIQDLCLQNPFLWFLTLSLVRKADARR